MRKNRGITLIALIVTIIVMLILVSVALSLISGDNGIIKKAETAATTTNNASAKTEIELAAAEFTMLYYEKKDNDSVGKSYMEYMSLKLTNYETSTGAKIDCDTDGNIIYTNSAGNKIYVEMNSKGEVEVLGEKEREVETASDSNIKYEVTWSGKTATVIFSTQNLKEEYTIETSTDNINWSAGNLETVESGTQLYVRLNYRNKVGASYAVVKPMLKCTVTFDTNGGTTSEAAQEVEYGGTYGTLPTPTRIDCDFEGWYTDKKIASGTKIEETSTYNLTENQTLYAVWSHTHKTATDATLVSGTALGNDGAYKTSGGCYTTANSSSKVCGSTDWSINAWGSGPTSYGSNGTCHGDSTWATRYYWINTVARCNICGGLKTNSGKTYMCGHWHITYPSSPTDVAISYYFGSCSNNVTSTYYTRSCGLPSGILDQ